MDFRRFVFGCEYPHEHFRNPKPLPWLIMTSSASLADCAAQVTKLRFVPVNLESGALVTSCVSSEGAAISRFAVGRVPCCFSIVVVKLDGSIKQRGVSPISVEQAGQVLGKSFLSSRVTIWRQFVQD